MRRSLRNENNWIRTIQMHLYRIYIMKKTILIISLICLLIGGLFGSHAGIKSEQKKSKTKIAALEKKAKKESAKLKAANSAENEKTAENDKSEESVDTGGVVSGTKDQEVPWNLILVNSTHPLSETYIPELTEVTPGYSVDTRVAEPLTRMLNDAQTAGMQMYICSAYRNLEYQKEVFNQTMGDFIANGASYYDAYAETAKSVAVPGTSEHALGLTVDIVSREYELLDERQAQTREAQWLAANAYRYGFILRYPPDKMAITGIIFEPWHYRYVGEDVAKIITEKGITFEEYLEMK